MLALLCLACTADSVSPGPGVTEPGDGGETGTGGQTDSGEEIDEGFDEELEEVPGFPGPDDLFRDDVIHELRLNMSNGAMDDLRASPKEYVEAELVTDFGTYTVGVRLKGNTSFDELDGKPAFKIDVNHVVPGQTVWGQPSFYLQNKIWDPSHLHEFLTYGFFQDAGVPASRAAFSTVQVNDSDYGLYLVLEKQNGAFMRHRFGDDSGSIYESGSFNYPCDLTSGAGDTTCTCFEVDAEGSADTFADLQDLCTAARNPGALDEVLADEMDMDLWRRSAAAEMLVSHYDNYFWNLNNFRVAHLPETGKWVFTPWSTDLSWGWYPWVGGPHCGMYGVTPGEYWGGALMDRCWMEPACATALHEQLLELADLFEEVDMLDRLERGDELISSLAKSEWRGNYGPSDYEQEVACMSDYIAQRPATIREWVAAQ